VPGEFLTAEQAEAYFFDDDDRDLIALRRTGAHRLGATPPSPSPRPRWLQSPLGQGRVTH
jgi:hypothetical protein